MPVNTYWKSEGFVYEASGIVSAHEITAGMDNFSKLPEGIDTKYQIVNALQVDEIQVSELELVNITADDISLSRKLPFLRVALIANEGPVMENFIKYLKISWGLNTSWDIRIFNTLEAAEDWLKYIPA